MPQTALSGIVLVRSKLTIRPNNANASPKIITIIITTKSDGCCATHLVACYPATPIAIPADSDAIPLHAPAAK